MRVEVLPPSLVVEQIRAAIEDIPPGAAKTGALGSADVVAAVAVEAKRFAFPLVVDPVMISKHGALLMGDSARAAMRDLLLPVTTLLTPNLHEAAALSALTVDSPDAMRDAAQRLCAAGCKSVLVKGGHLAGEALDVLLFEGEFYEYRAARIDTPHTHGTGCTYSAAITAELAKGASIPDAVRLAKDFITRAIRSNPGLGGGAGPVNHFA